MHRFFLPPEQCGADSLSLTDREAHHALHVLRLRIGDSVTVLDGAGRELLCEVEDLSRASVRLAVREPRLHPPPPARVTLLQAIPKGKIIESIIQKATELGVARIVPLLSERVATQVDDDGAGRKAEKWQMVAVEAVKQCGAPWLPRVLPPMTPAAFVARGEAIDLPLLGSLQPGSRHPRAVLSAYQSTHGRNPRSAAVWIGPEGDFTLEEIGLIEQSSAQPITLGPLVLRTETAAIYCLSILSYEFQWEFSGPARGNGSPGVPGE